MNKCRSGQKMKRRLTRSAAQNTFACLSFNEIGSCTGKWTGISERSDSAQLKLSSDRVNPITQHKNDFAASVLLHLDRAETGLSFHWSN